MVLASPVPTQRMAFDLARRSYEALYERIAASGDADLVRLARPVFESGLTALSSLQGRVSDVTLSTEASEAIAAYLTSLETDDVDSQLTWLGMLPQALRDVYRETARPAVSIAYVTAIVTGTPIVHVARQAPQPQTPWNLRVENATGGWKAA